MKKIIDYLFEGNNMKEDIPDLFYNRGKVTHNISYKTRWSDFVPIMFQNLKNNTIHVIMFIIK
jgi:hypothetical protein